MATKRANRPKETKIQFWASLPLAWRMILYAKRHLIPRCRPLKRLIELLPWDRDDKVIVALCIKKSLLNDRERLRAALHEAAELIVNAERV